MLELKDVLLYLALIAVTYFFMELLTDKNRKLSAIGTILVCCSAFTVFRKMQIAILTGEATLILFEQIIKNKNVVIKLVLSAILGFALGVFNVTYYHAYEVNSFTRVILFTYIALAIWRVLEHKKEFKLDKYFWCILVACVILASLASLKILYDHCFNTLPKASMEYYVDGFINYEENGFMHLFSYGYSMFLPFVQTENNIIYTSFLSVFPVSLIVAMVYVYKKEKHVEFFMPMILAIVGECVFCMLTKMNMQYDCVAGAVGLSCIYLYIYMFAHIEENIFKLADSAKIVLGLLVFYFLVPRPKVFMTKGYMYGLAVVITLLYFMFINFADKRYQKILLVVLVVWSIISTVPAFFLNVM